MMYQDLLPAAALEQYAQQLNARAAPGRGRLTAAALRDRILESGGRCEWCAASLLGAPFELDHIVSLHQGGANSADNLVVACPACNRRKGRKHPARFAAEIYNETGCMTRLINWIYRHYDIKAAQQLSFFAGEKPKTRANSAEEAHETTMAAPWID